MYEPAEGVSRKKGSYRDISEQIQIIGPLASAKGHEYSDAASVVFLFAVFL